ncbi:hypothetical protein Taro_050317 [Colocasia esculenta]|uniref:Uncharacterized protein n=1 Tax=Colocasia esculenta TaxID=4460 RepID=A0A843XDS6_COLES|nr:hypothetical protein [Colocasia esculenta]
MQTQAQTQAALQAQLQAHAHPPSPVPQEHDHGGPSIMERFKRMAPPPFKGESQPLLAERWRRSSGLSGVRKRIKLACLLTCYRVKARQRSTKEDVAKATLGEGTT